MFCTGPQTTRNALPCYTKSGLTQILSSVCLLQYSDMLPVFCKTYQATELHGASEVTLYAVAKQIMSYNNLL